MRNILVAIVLLIGGGFCAFGQESASEKNASVEKPPVGVVRLRVEFLASGEIGKIEVVDSLPDGLTEQAIAAARQIKFEPKKVNGVAQTVTKLVEYTFTLVYDDGDPEIISSIEIIEMPRPESLSNKKDRESIGAAIRVTATFYPDGKIVISTIEGELPKKLRRDIEKTVMRIRFKPAIHKTGIPVPQTKQIVYEIGEGK